ncbi:MAG: hypothetical protein GY705_29620 [Bacteroidetes bacterium]|nr:hypothetical protein [Bacteroidota bacterium]
MRDLIFSLLTFMLSMSLSAQTHFQKCFGGNSDDEATGVEIIDEDIYISSTTRSFGAGERDIMLNKMNSSGNLIWTKVMGTAKRNLSFGLQRIGLEIIVYGQTIQHNNLPWTDDVFFKCLNGNGEIVWGKYYGNISEGNDEHAGGFHVLENNQILFSAFNLWGFEPNLPSTRSAYLAKVDSVGNYVWSFAYDKIAMRSEWMQNIFSGPDAYYATGRMGVIGNDVSVSNNNDLYLLKTDLEGEISWWKFYNITNKNNGFHYSSLRLKDGNMLIVGGVSKSFMDSDILLIKADTEGEILWSKSIGGDGFDVANACLPEFIG